MTKNWNYIMNAAQQEFLGEISVPRSSLATFLEKIARHPSLVPMHREGKLPYIFVAPPQFYTSGEEVPDNFNGWVLLEWVYELKSGDKMRMRVYHSFDPGLRTPVYCYLDESLTPSHSEYLTIYDEKTFLSDLKEFHSSKSTLTWYDQRPPRMKSRETVPPRLHHSWGVRPDDVKILQEWHKLVCQLALDVFEMFCHIEDDEEAKLLIPEFDEILKPAYMPRSSDYVFVADILGYSDD